MSQKSRVVLKTKFEAGRTPAEKDFSDVIDSGINQIDDQLTIRNTGEGDKVARYVGIGSVDPESPVSIRNRSGDDNLLGFEDHEGNEKWRIEIDPENGDEGLNIREKDTDDSNLFIRSGGGVGIGTKHPVERLEVKGKIRADEFLGTLDWNSLANIPVSLLVPKGIIVMWSGAADKIPQGWVLCDGRNTEIPDLRDRFIVGAGLNYAGHSKGGLKEVALNISQLPAHYHSGRTNDAGNHHHAVHGTDHNNTPASVDYSGDEYGRYINNQTTTADAGNHGHDFTTGNTGGNQPHENLPPYYALCFIMKV